MLNEKKQPADILSLNLKFVLNKYLTLPLGSFYVSFLHVGNFKEC